MAAPHQNIADIVVLKASAEGPDIDDFNLDGSAPVGLSLATMRKAKGLTHADVHAGTKIKPAHIAAIEAGDLSALPATPFTAGFVKAYAQFLGLDADRFARAYKEETGFVPLAAPALTAIMREAAKTRTAETRSDEPFMPDDALPPAAPAAAAAPALSPALSPMLSPALSPVLATPPLRPLASERAAWTPAAPSRGIEADKLVTWLGAGAAIAVAAFLAGRAGQPQQTASEIAAPPPTVIAEAPASVPAPAPVAAAPAPVEVAPPVAEPAPAVVAAVKAPIVKPKPKQAPAEDVAAAPLEVTPVSVLFSAPAIEAAPAVVEEAPPAAAVVDEAPAEPQPAIVPARMIRGAKPEYPERCAGRAGEKVAVSVVFTITAEGKPVSASVISSSDRCFNPAAQRAIYDMRFSPRTIDGVPTLETGKSVTVQFVR